MFHNTQWTFERIARFWNFLASRPGIGEAYFSRSFAGPLLRLLATRTRLRGPALDVGCGPGFLLERLAQAGIDCRGIDPSQASVEAVNRRLAGNGRFLGASVGSITATGLADGSASLAFAVEVLEHLLPEQLPLALGELRRVLADDGHLCVTVPNREELERSELACPECGCVFHRWQHLRSFTPQGLAELLAAHGFQAVFLAETDLRHWRFGLLRRTRAQWLARKAGVAPPHLVALARKAGGAA